jgi:hypothetical protein
LDARTLFTTVKYLKLISIRKPIVRRVIPFGIHGSCCLCLQYGYSGMALRYFPCYMKSEHILGDSFTLHSSLWLFAFLYYKSTRWKFWTDSKSSLRPTSHHSTCICCGGCLPWVDYPYGGQISSSTLVISAARHRINYGLSNLNFGSEAQHPTVGGLVRVDYFRLQDNDL